MRSVQRLGLGAMSKTASVTADLRDGWAEITIKRAGKRNAMNLRMWQDLRATIEELGDTDIACALLQGDGDDFVVGSDLTEIVDRGAHDALNAEALRTVMTLRAAPYATIAAVRGAALGGGFELALACDLRFADQSATFGCPEARLGMVPGAGATVRLPRLIGQGRATSMILLGESVGAAEALQIGLIDWCGTSTQLLEHARGTAVTLGTRDHLSLRAALEVTRAQSGMTEDVLRVERISQALCFATGAAQGKVRNWLERQEGK